MHQLIAELREDSLREKIIIPLLYAFGCKYVKSYCGPSEDGKDIIYRVNHFFMGSIWGAVILKIGKIDVKDLYNCDSKVCGHLRRAIWSFPNPDGSGSVKAQEILVITSGVITRNAIDCVLRGSGKDFPSIHFVDGERLKYLIGEVISKYNKKNNEHKLSMYEFSVDSFAKAVEQYQFLCSLVPEKVSLSSLLPEGRLVSN